MGPAFRVGLATAAFGTVHSLLASRPAKAFAARAVGTRRRDAAYRVVYNMQAVATFALLLRYGSRQPTHTLYRVRGPLAWLLRATQAAGLVWAYRAAREVGIARAAGLVSLEAHRHRAPIAEGPAAQGPERQDNGTLGVGGPFRWSRHPLNLAPLPVFWATPHLTTRRLAFNVVATAYLVIGSLHEEHRLRSVYGLDYETYRRSGVPFFVPRLLSRPRSTHRLAGRTRREPFRDAVPSRSDAPC